MSDFMVIEEISAKIEEMKTIAEEAKSAATQAKTAADAAKKAAGGYELAMTEPYEFTGSANADNYAVKALGDFRNIYLSPYQVTTSNSTTTFGGLKLRFTANTSVGCTMTVRFTVTIYGADGSLIGSFYRDLIYDIGTNSSTVYAREQIVELPLFIKISRIKIEAYVRDCTVNSTYWHAYFYSSLTAHTKAFQVK